MSHPAREDVEAGRAPIAAPGALSALFADMRAERAATRDAAWAECYSRYRGLVWSRVFYVVRTIGWLEEPREVAEDVTSDVFVGLPAALAQYREDGRPEQWLKQVAVRAALRARAKLTGEWNGRGNRSSARRFLSIDAEAEHIVRTLDAVDPEELMELERRIDTFRASRDQRRRRWAEFLDLYRAGYGFGEIGARMGIGEGTARNWLVEIRRQLAAGEPNDD